MSGTFTAIDGLEICNRFVFSMLEARERPGTLVPGVHSPLQASLDETKGTRCR
jgi:hypothetical protein